jgi:hypothetical protein
MFNRLLKKAHLPRWCARAALRRTRKYASHLAGYPSEGWVTPPCIWTFLSSLGVNESFLEGQSPFKFRVFAAALKRDGKED